MTTKGAKKNEPHNWGQELGAVLSPPFPDGFTREISSHTFSMLDHFPLVVHPEHFPCCLKFHHGNSLKEGTTGRSTLGTLMDMMNKVAGWMKIAGHG